MSDNKFEDTTGFFIHDFHVESVNESSDDEFKEDPIWLYLDIHWSFTHAPKLTKKKKKITETKTFWHHYVTEVPNLIHSLWGTIGCFDCKFGSRAGKNQAAICVAILAMQDLFPPSQWTPGILDSAVICGDCYYVESQQSSTKCCHKNPFNLQSCFRITSHLWKIKFQANFCGILYAGGSEMSLAEILKLALEKSSNLLLKCKSIVFAIFQNEDDFFVVDPRWTGPPLFEQEHGSLYVLRCRNINSLLYSLTKMLNTNQKLEVQLTPVEMCFCRATNAGAIPKKIQFNPVRTSPGETSKNRNFIPGTEIVPESDDYRRFNKNLAMGIKYGDLMENLPISYRSEINEERLDNFLKSFQNEKNEDEISSNSEILRECEFCEFPKLMDFVGDKIMRKEIINKEATMAVAKPVGCFQQPSFILEESRDLFRQKTKEMRLRKFKNYKHRIPSGKDDNEQDTLDQRVVNNVDQNEAENQHTENGDDQPENVIDVQSNELEQKEAEDD